MFVFNFWFCFVEFCFVLRCVALLLVKCSNLQFAKRGESRFNCINNIKLLIASLHCLRSTKQAGFDYCFDCCKLDLAILCVALTKQLFVCYTFAIANCGLIAALSSNQRTTKVCQFRAFRLCPKFALQTSPQARVARCSIARRSGLTRFVFSRFEYASCTLICCCQTGASASRACLIEQKFDCLQLAKKQYFRPTNDRMKNTRKTAFLASPKLASSLLSLLALLFFALLLVSNFAVLLPFFVCCYVIAGKMLQLLRKTNFCSRCVVRCATNQNSIPAEIVVRAQNNFAGQVAKKGANSFHSNSTFALLSLPLSCDERKTENKTSSCSSKVKCRRCTSSLARSKSAHLFAQISESSGQMSCPVQAHNSSHEQNASIKQTLTI